MILSAGGYLLKSSIIEEKNLKVVIPTGLVRYPRAGAQAAHDPVCNWFLY